MTTPTPSSHYIDYLNQLDPNFIIPEDKRHGGDVLLERNAIASPQAPWKKTHQGKYLELGAAEKGMFNLIFAKGLNGFAHNRTSTNITGQTQFAEASTTGQRQDVITMKDFGLDLSKWCVMLEQATIHEPQDRLLENPRFVLSVVYYLLGILKPFHAQGLLHLDLKRDNICIAATRKDAGQAFAVTLDLSKMTVIDLQFGLPDSGRKLHKGANGRYLFANVTTPSSIEGNYVSPRYTAAAEQFISSNGQADKLLKQLDWRADLHSVASWLHGWAETYIPKDGQHFSRELAYENFYKYLALLPGKIDEAINESNHPAPHEALIQEIFEKFGSQHPPAQWAVTLPKVNGETAGTASHISIPTELPSTASATPPVTGLPAVAMRPPVKPPPEPLQTQIKVAPVPDKPVSPEDRYQWVQWLEQWNNDYKYHSSLYKVLVGFPFVIGSLVFLFGGAFLAGFAGNDFYRHFYARNLWGEAVSILIPFLLHFVTVIALINNYDQLRPEKKQQHLAWLSAWLLIVVGPLLFSAYQWGQLYYQKNYGVSALQTLYQLANPSKTDAQGKRVYNGEVQLTPSKQQYAIGEPLRFTVLSPSSQPGYLSVLAYSADNPTNGLSLLVSNEPIVAREQGAISLPTNSMMAKGSVNGGALLAQGPAGKVRLLAIVTPTPFDWQGRSASNITLPSTPVIADLFTCENRAEPSISVKQCDAQRALAGYAPSKVMEVSIVNAVVISAAEISAPSAVPTSLTAPPPPAPATPQPPVKSVAASTLRKPPTTDPCTVNYTAKGCPGAQAKTAPTKIDGYEILDDPVLGKSSLARDPKTGLVWQRCSVGQTWNGNTCTGVAKNLFSSNFKQLELNGWRVPSVRELATLIQCPNNSPKTMFYMFGSFKSEISHGCDRRYVTTATINKKVFPRTSVDLFCVTYYIGPGGKESIDSSRCVNFFTGEIEGQGNVHGNPTRLIRA